MVIATPEGLVWVFISNYAPSDYVVYFLYSSNSTSCKFLMNACEPFLPNWMEGRRQGAHPAIPQNPLKLPGEHVWWGGGEGSPGFFHLALTSSDTAASTTPAA